MSLSFSKIFIEACGAFRLALAAAVVPPATPPMTTIFNLQNLLYSGRLSFSFKKGHAPQLVGLYFIYHYHT
jgi:hypothetical protein